MWRKVKPQRVNSLHGKAESSPGVIGVCWSAERQAERKVRKLDWGHGVNRRRLSQHSKDHK